MRPIMLQGHTRALTQVRYNREGDLLFSVAKDATPSVWMSHNGERLGTYVGHGAVVWSIAVSASSTRLITGSADWKAKVWDTETGKVLLTYENQVPVRSVDVSLGDQLYCTVTDAVMGHNSAIRLYDVRQNSTTPTRVIELAPDAKKVTVARFGYLNRAIIAGHEDGEMANYSVADGAKLVKKAEHTAAIMDIQLMTDQTSFVSASKDMTAKIFDSNSLNVLKTYQTDRPVNSASIAPDRDHVLVGGGQEAMQVTQTSLRSGKFEVRIFHKILAEEIGRVKGHFGPINTLHYHPSGRGFASGGEDGFVRLHQFDPEYFDFKVDY